MKTRFVLAVLVCLSGCYPVYKTLQPDTEFVVVDESQQPIDGAQVFFISSSYPYGYEKFRMSRFTNRFGQAYFNSIHDFRTEILLPHGIESFFWNWCVSKDGYETNVSNNNAGYHFSSETRIVLKKGNSTPCKSEQYFNIPFNNNRLANPVRH